MCIVWCGVALQDTCALCVNKWEVRTPESGGVANVKPSGELHNCRYARRNARLTPTSERRAVLRFSRSRHPHVIIVGRLESPRSSQRLK